MSEWLYVGKNWQKMASAPGPWRAQRSKSRGRKDLQLEVIHFRYHPYQTKKLNTLIYFVLFLERWGWRVGGSSLSTGCATAPRLMSSGPLLFGTAKVFTNIFASSPLSFSQTCTVQRSLYNMPRQVSVRL